MVRRGRRHDDQVDLGGVDAGIGDRGLGRLEADDRGRLVIGSDVALADAGALDDPLVAGVDLLSEFGIGNDAGGQIGAATDDL